MFKIYESFPQDFPQFFEAIKTENYARYISNLEDELKG